MSSSERQRSRQRTRALFINTIKATLKKPEKLTVSQWAEKYRVLDESSNFSGKWSNDITPYLVGIMDAFNDPYIQEINFCKPTQVGGTEAMLNMLGWIIMDNPLPTMIVYPSDDLAKEVDFFSIGTNDLTQYTLAIDRQNEKLDRFYNPHHKAILRMIQTVVDNAHKEGKWAGICGELGADTELTETFVKMGIDELSVAPSMILKLRKIVRDMP